MMVSEWKHVMHDDRKIRETHFTDSKALTSAQRSNFYKGIAQVWTDDTIQYCIPFVRHEPTYNHIGFGLWQNRSRIGYILRVISAEEISKKMLHRLGNQYLVSWFVVKQNNAL